MAGTTERHLSDAKPSSLNERERKRRESQATTLSSFKPEDDDFDWPYDISIDLRKSPKPRVAFQSGEHRPFFPDRPGHSRMGVEHSIDMSAKTGTYYCPPIIGVHKPISLLGYGIGGLLAPRFPKNFKGTGGPDPGAYHVIVDRSKVKAIRRPYDINDNVLRWQCRVGFGSTNTVSRFGIERTDVPPGPGLYNVANVSKCPSVKRKESFGYKRYLLPAVITICMVDGGEKCCECGEVQLADYYRSKTKLRHPEKKRAQILAICRRCYCKAWNGHFPYWIKPDLQRMFRKARHCNFIHDHQKLPQFMRKTTCKDVNKLTRKEVVLNKFYVDCCPAEYTIGGKK